MPSHVMSIYAPIMNVKDKEYYKVTEIEKPNKEITIILDDLNGTVETTATDDHHLRTITGK